MKRFGKTTRIETRGGTYIYIYIYINQESDHKHEASYIYIYIYIYIAIYTARCRFRRPNLELQILKHAHPLGLCAPIPN